jgi:hypothetical protein
VTLTRAARRLATAVVVLGTVCTLLAVPARGVDTLLFGDQTVGPSADSNGAGRAEAFRTTASASGTLSSLTVWVDSGSSGSLVVGLYADSSNHPGALLAQGTLTSPTSSAWNTVSVPATSISSGSNYWIALLGPNGTLRFRDRCCPGRGSTPSETASQSGLTTLPSSWRTGSVYASDGPLSAYGSS